jgi:hypothetical protein
MQQLHKTLLFRSGKADTLLYMVNDLLVKVC